MAITDIVPSDKEVAGIFTILSSICSIQVKITSRYGGGVTVIDISVILYSGIIPIVSNSLSHTFFSFF